MSVLNPTPPERLIDASARPYFLWDVDITLADFRLKLQDPDPELRAYWIGKLMRQAKPDDVFSFVTLRQITQHWPLLTRYLGHTTRFWTWLKDSWEEQVFTSSPSCQSTRDS